MSVTPHDDDGPARDCSGQSDMTARLYRRVLCFARKHKRLSISVGLCVVISTTTGAFLLAKHLLGQDKVAATYSTQSLASTALEAPGGNSRSFVSFIGRVTSLRISVVGRQAFPVVLPVECKVFAPRAHIGACRRARELPLR